MEQLARIFLLVFVLLSFFSCTENAVDSEYDGASVTGRLYQNPGCAGEGWAKAADRDSCFSYTFDENLVADFCVFANCCPDTHRFEFTYEVRTDSIIVAVADTAAHLCRCTCNYGIHTEFSDLSRNQYTFYCNYYDLLIYAEEVKRSTPG